MYTRTKLNIEARDANAAYNRNKARVLKKKI